DVLHRLEHDLAQVTGPVAVAQLHRFLRTGGCAGGHHRASEAAIGERDFGFERGVATGVEDFAGVDPGDAGHLSRRITMELGKAVWPRMARRPGRRYAISMKPFFLVVRSR